MSKTFYNKSSVFAKAVLVTILVSSTLAWAQPSPKSLEAKNKDSNHSIEQSANADTHFELVSSFVRQYIEQEVQIKGGAFVIFDPLNKEPIQLTLMGISSRDILRASDNLFVVPVSFGANNEDSYVVDFLIVEQEETWAVSQIAIRAENGKLRYSWQNHEGSWKRSYVTEAQGSAK